MAKKYVWKYVCICLWKDANVLPDMLVTSVIYAFFRSGIREQAAVFTKPCVS